MNLFADMGKQLARTRKARNLTQAELASQAGLGLSTLARFEAGLARELGLRKFLAMLDVLGYELRLVPRGQSRTLDDVLAERTRPR